MRKLKPARVHYGKTIKGSRTVTLRSGMKGRGRILLKIHEWPWSSQSRQETERLIDAFEKAHFYKFYTTNMD